MPDKTPLTLGYALRVVCFLGLACNPAQAESTDSLPAYNSLLTPASPAFSLLGAAPTEIAKPTTPADLAVTALSKSGNFTAIPRQFALETSPYWLFLHPRLSWRDDTARGLGASLARTGTVSFATAQIGDSAKPITGLAVSAKASLFSGSMSRKARGWLAEAETTEAASSHVYGTVMIGMKAKADSLLIRILSDSGKSPEEKNLAVKAHAGFVAKVKDSVFISPIYIRAIDSIRLAREGGIREIPATRQGFLLEAAIAAAWDFPDNIADSGEFDQFAVWLTPAYVFESNNLVGILRYGWSGGNDAANAFDAGAKWIWAWKEYALAGEGVWRYLTVTPERDKQWKADATFEWNILPNQWVTFAFGKDFRGNAKNSLYASVGVTLNFARRRWSLDLDQMKQAFAQQ